MSTSQPTPVCGRFAPSPSGRMHLGNVFACLLAWLSARSVGGGFLLRMEDLLDDMHFPQSFSAVRSFGAPPERTAASPPAAERQEGQRATFAVRVLFRQNASWQGSLTWLEEGKEESFRSVLELLLLMHSALDPETR